MAVDERRPRDDLYDVALRPHDERVELGGWVYYVRGVKSDAELTPRAATPTGLMFVDVPVLAARGIKRLTGRRKPWTVAIVRIGSVRTWNDVRPRVVHREVLSHGQDPGPRIAELVGEVRHGLHAPKR